MQASRDETTGKWTLSGVEPSEVTFERMCKMLREGENFKFARYGDGEFNCMFGKHGHNCDGHEYFPDLGTALNNAFYSDPQYMVGIQPLAVQSGMWERAKQREGYPKNIYDADVLHSASIDGVITELLDACKKRTPTLIGPKHLGALSLPQLEIPKENCWVTYQESIRLIEYRMNWEYGDVFLLCASMMSEVIIDYFKEVDATFIDCGSVFDPYVGVKSRRYHHKLAL